MSSHEFKSWKRTKKKKKKTATIEQPLNIMTCKERGKLTMAMGSHGVRQCNKRRDRSFIFSCRDIYLCCKRSRPKTSYELKQTQIATPLKLPPLKRKIQGSYYSLFEWVVLCAWCQVWQGSSYAMKMNTQMAAPVVLNHGPRKVVTVASWGPQFLAYTSVFPWVVLCAWCQVWPGSYTMNTDGIPD